MESCFSLIVTNCSPSCDTCKTIFLSPMSRLINYCTTNGPNFASRVAYAPTKEEDMTFQNLITHQRNLTKLRSEYIVIRDTSNHLSSSSVIKFHSFIYNYFKSNNERLYKQVKTSKNVL